MTFNTCDCTRPFSVTTQCVDADIPTNISNSVAKIFHFIITTFPYPWWILFFVFATYVFQHKNVTDGSIMNGIGV
jgi:hypothetical protein